MAVPINPGMNPAVSGPKRTDFERNAVQIGAAQSAAREVQKEDVTAPAARPDQGLKSQVISPGVVCHELGDGVAEMRTDSGMAVNFSNGHQHIKLPGGAEIFHDLTDNSIVARDGGQPVEVEPFKNEQGQYYGFAYTRPDGTRVTVNTEDLTFVLQRGQVTQSIGADGSQVIQMTSQFRGERGRFSDLKQTILVTPDGQVESLGKAQEGVQVGPKEMSFKNPGGAKITVELPAPLQVPLSGDLAAPPPPPPPPAVAVPQNFGNAVLMQDGYTPGAPGNPAVAQGNLNPYIYNPPVGDGLVNTPSGISRFRNAAGTTLNFQNGICMMDVGGDARLTTADGMAGGPVEVTQRIRPNAPPETQYRFNDTAGNTYTCFSDSLDFMVASPDGRAIQVMQPDGRVYGAIRTPDGQVKRFEIAPDGYNNHDAGMGFGWDNVKREYNRVHLQGDPNPIPLPYPIGEFQKFSSSSAGAGSAYPTSGQLPPGFGTPTPPVPTPPGQFPPTPPGQFTPGQMPPTPAPGGPQFAELSPSLGQELAALQAEKAANPAAFPPDKQARLDLLSKMTQADPYAGARPTPGPQDPYAPSIMPRPGYPQQPMRPGFMDRLKYLFTGNPQNLQPPQSPARPGLGMPPTQHPMAGQLGGYPNNQFGYGPGMLAPFQSFVAQESAMTSMMGMWAMMNTMNMGWGGAMWYTPFSPFTFGFF